VPEKYIMHPFISVNLHDKLSSRCGKLRKKVVKP